MGIVSRSRDCEWDPGKVVQNMQVRQRELPETGE